MHVAEVARIVAAILDQMSVGADKHGLFHYCSLGETGYLAFAEAILASQHQPFESARDLLDDVTDPDAAMTNHSLDCGAIRREFGIQQLPWRGFVDRR